MDDQLAVEITPDLAAGMVSDGEAGIAPPSAEVEDPIATRLAALEQGLETERQEKAALEQRLRDTQSWGQQSHNANLLAQAQIQAQSQEYERRQQQDAWRQSLQPPSFSEEEREAMIADPNALTASMFKVADWTRRATLAEVAPHLETARAFSALAEPLYNQGRETAIERARNVAKTQLDIDGDLFDQLMPAATQILNSVPDRAAASKMWLDPTVIAHALNVARTQGGVPLKKPKTTPTIGSGNAAPGGRSASQPSAFQAEMERKFGMKLPPGKVRELEEKHKAARRAAGA